jgi:hypothetical protein
MSAPENPNPNTASDAQLLNEIRAAVESLRGVFQVAALSGIVLSCTLLLYFYRETRLVGRQNAEFKAFIADYNANTMPKLDAARTNLQVFARTNPTFVPIFNKYFATNSAATNAAPKP